MKKLLLVCVCLYGLLSCESDKISETGNVMESEFIGAIFKSWDDFYAYHIPLEKLNDEFEVLNAISGKNYSSFLELAIDSDDMDKLNIADQLTYGLMAIMNQNLEFMVAGKIIGFKDGGFYESDLSHTKSTKINNLQVSILNIDNQSNTDVDSKIFISGNNTGGYSHRDFWRNAYYRCSDNAKILGPSSRQMRYTQQLKSLRSGDTAFLFIETKLYWRNSSNDLRYAETEERNYTYDIDGYVDIGVLTAYGWRTQVTPINFQRTVNCTKSKWNRQQLASAFPTDGRSWGIDLTGTITHHINGDLSSNKWYAPVYWR